MIREALLSERYAFKEDYMPYFLTPPQKQARDLFLEELHKKNRYTRLTECPYCGKSDFIKISEVNKRGLPSDIVICDSCDGCFKLNILNRAAAAYYYENISHILVGKGVSQEAMEERFARRLHAFSYPRYHFISNLVELDPQKDLIAEFGCNDGANLFPWKEKGFAVIGIDLDLKMVEFGRKKGLNLVKGDMLDYDPGVRVPRLIILSHLLGHVTDINATLDKLTKITRPDGYLFIEVPGIRSHALADALRFFDVELNYYFDLKSLTIVLERCGLNIIYGDEYARVLCGTDLAASSCAAGKSPASFEKIKARILRRIVRCAGFQNKRLLEILKEGERNSLRARLVSRLQRMYFESIYRAMSKCPRT